MQQSWTAWEGLQYGRKADQRGKAAVDQKKGRMLGLRGGRRPFTQGFDVGNLSGDPGLLSPMRDQRGFFDAAERDFIDRAAVRPKLEIFRFFIDGTPAAGYHDG